MEFVTESLRIEGIRRKPSNDELDATANFIQSDNIGVEDVANLVRVYQPNARLRDVLGLNVRVGDHIAPLGGPEIREALSSLLYHRPEHSPWENHVRYETLHPFTDGNGRSGRALWAMDMYRRNQLRGLTFLHHFYYQTLSEARRKVSP